MKTNKVITYLKKYNFYIKHILYITIFITATYFLWRTFPKTIFTTLFAVFLFFIFDPSIDWLEKKLKSRKWAIVVFFLIFVIVLILILGIVIPGLVKQVGKFIQQYPYIVGEFQKKFNQLQTHVGTSAVFRKSELGIQIQKAFETVFQTINKNLVHSIQSIVNILARFVTGLITLIIALVMAVYLLIDEKNVKKFFHKQIASRISKSSYEMLGAVKNIIAEYIRGLTTLALIIFVADWILYTAIGLPYAIILALWGGIMEFLPIVGPFLAFIPAIIVALLNSWVTALILLILFLIIQFIEANILAPRLLGKKMKHHPFVIIVFMLIGAEISGILGMIVAVPIGTIILRWIEWMLIRGKKLQ
ncbi:AI-2E family transporter [Candidatus Margulisiibacteriota bacterium]